MSKVLRHLTRKGFERVLSHLSEYKSYKQTVRYIKKFLSASGLFVQSDDISFQFLIANQSKTREHQKSLRQCSAIKIHLCCLSTGSTVCFVQIIFLSFSPVVYTFDVLVQHVINYRINVLIHVLKQDRETIFDSQLKLFQKIWIVEGHDL